ncbi:MAG: glycosyltransferase family 39 protein [Verrucomicrobiota bacterium]|jgi:4-amino-4-deoxy-L-arabinose transferase-like glycosyltransferase/membrane-associated phospholipid phosphatase
MHWLLTLDTGLFHFINRSLSNPLCDWLMPILSGDGVHWFIPLAVCLGLAALAFGNARLRLCTLMILLVVALGDPLVINTIKHAVARPRPCLVLPDAIARLGGTGSGSMPSAHAANWFAMTMIAFLFYRRSAWFMLLMASAVSFSRIYNGVHYPSDVLVGAILGAGYAVALAVALEFLWQLAGKKWFPLWHAQLPSLLNPAPRQKTNVEPRDPELDTRHPTLDQHWLRLGYAVIFVLLVARWIYIAGHTIDLEKDEAYQWLWSKHLAWSYFSKPPGIALIQFISTSLFGDTQFGVRFFSPLFAAMLSLLLLRFLAREVGTRPSFWLLLIATAAPLLSSGTILMTIDPPLVLCWTWAMVAGWRAVQSGGKTRDWLIVGLAMGLGFLCKYTAACQLVSWAIFFALWQQARIHMRRPGPWLALLVFLLCTTPVLIWNAQHGWITVRHVAGDAGLLSPSHPAAANGLWGAIRNHFRYFMDFLSTQGTLLNPIFFIGMLWAMFAFWRRWRERPLWLYFFCMGAPVYLGYGLYSFHSRILPNWPVAGVLPLFCLMVAWWNERPRLARPLLGAGIVLGIFAVALAHQTDLIAKILGEPLPGEMDPLRRVRAWRPTAALVEDAREKLATEGKPAFIITDHYGMTGLFSFYLPQAHAALKDTPLVYCMNVGQPVNELYYWPAYDYQVNRQGQNAIFVSELDPYPLEKGWFWKWLRREKVEYAKVPPPVRMPPRIAHQFASVADCGEQDIWYGDRIFRRIHLWACYDLKPEKEGAK